MHSSPLLDGDGKVTGAIVVLHDVTELHRLENVRKDFVGNVSHELKTPITAVRALAETLMDDSEMDSAVRKRFLGKIREQSFRLSSIVTDLLTLSRLESEGGAIQFSELDLRETVRASVKALQSTGEGRGVQVESDLRDVPIQILGDEEALGQMVTNLLDNALKYTPEGGRVWVQLRAEGQWAIVEVHDTGIGIEPAEQERIFERFYRVDKARSRELGGTGLGLSIVKHIARTHKGDVTVESSLGAGSSFIIRLPLSPVAVSV
jgi:two-component system phosphate regulon sensor histidine kinase PhoR